MGPDAPQDGHNLRSAAGRRAAYSERDDGGREIAELYRGLTHAQSIGDREMEQFFADSIAKYGMTPEPPKPPRPPRGQFDIDLEAAYPEGKPR